MPQSGVYTWYGEQMAAQGASYMVQCWRAARSKLTPTYIVVLLACILVFGTACTSQKAPAQFGEPRDVAADQSGPSTEQSDGAANSQQLGQDQLLQAQASRSKKVEVVFSAQVARLLPDDRKGTPHQRFLLQLSNGTTVLVAHNTKMAPPVPIQVGDLVTIKGEYIWNDKGGVVHWTHHTDTPRHEGGYIQAAGQTYQ